MATDCRSFALVSQPTRHPDDLLIFLVVVSDHRIASKTLVEVEAKAK